MGHPMFPYYNWISIQHHFFKLIGVNQPIFPPSSSPTKIEKHRWMSSFSGTTLQSFFRIPVGGGIVFSGDPDFSFSPPYFLGIPPKVACWGMYVCIFCSSIRRKSMASLLLLFGGFVTDSLATGADRRAKPRREAYEQVRCNDEVEAQRRRWTFYEKISLALSFFPVGNILHTISNLKE